MQVLCKSIYTFFKVLLGTLALLAFLFPLFIDHSAPTRLEITLTCAASSHLPSSDLRSVSAPVPCTP